MEFQKKRFNIYAKYLPLIAKFSTELSGKKKSPEYRKLLKSQTVQDLIGEKENEQPAEVTAEPAQSVNDVSSGNEKVNKDAQERLEKYSDSS